MSLKNDVLYELMNTPGYISGEQLAQKFKKSRTAVWKAVRGIKRNGYTVEAVTNKGYRLVENNSLVTAENVKKYLRYDIDVIHFPSIDSTNTHCKRLLSQGKQGIFLITADNQTAGRGRQGKSFYSPAQTGVYFSLVLRPDAPLQNAVTATTAASVAVCKAIEKLTQLKPKIKWVNDVYISGKKVCGILTEANTDFESATVDSVIVGIGINISTSSFPDDIEGAGCLNIDVNRSALIAETVNFLIDISDGDYAGFIDYYRSHSMVIGKKIKFIKNGLATSAAAVAIDERGGLEVELENGEHMILRSGEITVRTQENESLTENAITKAYDRLPAEAREIREEVFVKEQGFVNEFDETDGSCVHFVMFYGGKAAATARAYYDDGAYYIGRVAVRKCYRSKGFGAEIVTQAEQLLEKRGAKKFVVHAQCRVKGFYEKLGYAQFGDEDFDEYCPHCYMKKEI